MPIKLPRHGSAPSRQSTHGPYTAYDLTYVTSDWTNVAEELAEKYPQEWEKRFYDENVQLYRDISEERAIRLEKNPH